MAIIDIIDFSVQIIWTIAYLLFICCTSKLVEGKDKMQYMSVYNRNVMIG